MGGIISSRTPEGIPNHCPVCQGEICIEPAQPPGDAPCPNCGTLLWFSRSSWGCRFYESRTVAPIREKVLHRIGDRLGRRAKEVRELTSWENEIGADSLDMVELVMELEEEFALTIPPEDVENIQTVADIIDYLAQRQA